MADCIILTGSKHKGPAVKTAGPHRIATQLREAGFSVQVIDISYFKNQENLLQIIKHFLEDSTLWIGISNTFMNSFCGVRWPGMEFDGKIEIIEAFKRFTKKIKGINPNVKFIYGNAGLRADISSAGFVKFEGFVDQNVLDYTLALQRGEDPKDAVYQREFDGFVRSKITWTDRDLLNGEKAVPIEISRGCIFRCDFCRFPLNGKKKFDYIKDLAILEEELLYNYEKFEIKDYIFTDDTLNDSTWKLEQLKTVFDRLPFKINFVAYVRLDLMMRYPEMVDLLKDLGILSATLGIETAVPENAKLIGKGVDFQKQMDFLAGIKQGVWKDVNVSSGFIIGLPYDDQKKIDDLLGYLMGNDCPLDNYIIAALQIYPTDKHQMTYSSVIDRDYAKLGYRFENVEGRDSWIHDGNQLNQHSLEMLVKKVHRESWNKVRYTGFELMDLQNIGVDKQDLLSMSKAEIDQKYDIDTLLKTNYQQYLRNLMRLPKR